MILNGKLIHISSNGIAMNEAAADAMKAGCGSFMFNDRIYAISISWRETGRLTSPRDQVATPAPPRPEDIF